MRKRKYKAFFLGLVVIMLLIPAASSASEEEWESAYADVLSLYRQAEKEGWDALKAYDHGCVWGFFGSGKKGAYALRDINEDGIPELFIGMLSMDSDITALSGFAGLYTLVDDEPVQLSFDSEVTGYHLCQDNTIYRDESWAFAEQYASYELLEEGSSLSYRDGVSCSIGDGKYYHITENE